MRLDQRFQCEYQFCETLDFLREEFRFATENDGAENEEGNYEKRRDDGDR